MKKFVGYYIMGASTLEDAKNEKGLMLWSQVKPGAMRRFLNRVLLGIYWIDKERVNGATAKSNPDVQLNKVRWSRQPKGEIKG